MMWEHSPDAHELSTETRKRKTCPWGLSMNEVHNIFGKYFPKIVRVVKLNFKIFEFYRRSHAVYPLPNSECGCRMEKPIGKIVLREMRADPVM